MLFRSRLLLEKESTNVKLNLELLAKDNEIKDLIQTIEHYSKSNMDNLINQNESLKVNNSFLENDSKKLKLQFDELKFNFNKLKSECDMQKIENSKLLIDLQNVFQQNNQNFLITKLYDLQKTIDSLIVEINRIH